VVLALAIASGVFIGLSLGALGGGGSILAVPVLVYLLGESPVAATTGSLLIVGISALTGAVAAWRAGNVYLARGVAFGLIGIAGAAAGALLSVHVDPDLLLGLFALLMLLVAGVMITKQVRSRGDRSNREPGPQVDEPIIAVRPTFMCNCPVAAKVLVTALAVGLTTGFFGVGGGFLVVPALVLALDLPMPIAVGTSLAVIAINSAAAFVTRVSGGAHLDWVPVIALTVAAVVGSMLGARVASRVDARKLGMAFSVLLVAVAVYTAWQSLPALIA
jgi:uncharacterized membrane protein YfcA